MKNLIISLVVLAVLAPAVLVAQPQEPTRNLAGSIQFDYLAVPTDPDARSQSLDGATVELSLKAAYDFNEHVSASVKVCVACHGVELGMAFFDVRIADELNFRVGRFTPAFGSFPLRHDPANHRTSDKPLPYDMGRMLRLREWNMSILPAPWVDNGVEVSGTRFFSGGTRIDYAAYVIGGPKGNDDAIDFDYTQSRSRERYYVDNNSEPSVGARIGTTIPFGETSSLSLGASTMAGHYDPSRQLGFAIAGIDAVLQLDRLSLRAEYLARWTQLSLGEDPASRFRYGVGEDGDFSDFSLKEGFYLEAEAPVGRVDLIGRFDGMRRRGNVLIGSTLRSDSLVLRYTIGSAIRVYDSLRLKTSVEFWEFSDFSDEVAIHMGVTRPF